MDISREFTSSMKSGSEVDEEIEQMLLEIVSNVLEDKKQ
jgi:hypothetical protein